MSALPTPLAGKLGLLIPRLASDHDGEVIATVRAKRRILAAQKLDLHDFARSLVIAREPSSPSDGPWREAVSFCLANVGRLTPREAGFLRSLERWTGTPTRRQRAWLEAICAKLGRSA